MTEKLNTPAGETPANAFAEAMKDAPAFGEHAKKEKNWNDYYRENKEGFFKLENAFMTEIYKNIDNDDYQALNSDKISHHGQDATNLGDALEQITIEKDGKDIECVNICWALLEYNDKDQTWKQHSNFGVYVPLKDFAHPVVSKRGADAKTEKALDAVAAAVANMGVNSMDGFQKAVASGRLGSLEKR